MSKYSLEPLTMIGCPPPDMIHIAARAGYDYVSLRAIPMGVTDEFSFYPSNKSLLNVVRSATQETGIGIHDIELARILKEVEPTTYLPAMELGAELGAKHLISSAWTQDQNDRDFIVERYAEICDLARPFGLTVSLEFPTFSRLSNLSEAFDIVRAANQPNSGLLIDTLYVHLSRVQLDEIAAVPNDWVHFIHVSDTVAKIPGSREGMIHIARDNRLYPGEGCIDFSAINDVLPDDLVYAIELPNLERIKQYGYEEHARQCLESTKTAFGDVENAFA